MVTSPTAIRVLQDPPLAGPANMARDEALMIRVGEGTSVPTLRLYQWSEPTISLGYFQRHDDCAELSQPVGGLPVVRRMTGGGAILHDLELTYSIALPIDHALVAGRPERLYTLAHDALIACLGSLGVLATMCGVTDDSSPTRGPFFCFQRRHRFDVLVGSDKIVGSAQRRTRLAILQHGSIILANRYDQQPTARAPVPFQQGIESLRSTFPKQLGELTGSEFVPGDWSAMELAAAETLTGKYAGDEWTKRA